LSLLRFHIEYSRRRYIVIVLSLLVVAAGIETAIIMMLE